MDILKAIMTRRSIRKYQDKTVSEDQLQSILKAAMMAPSAGNAQPWQFVVVKDQQTQSKIKDINPYAAMAEKAPLGILVCGDLRLEKFAGYWVQDCSAAVQNILLAAHGVGLGAVWTGIHPIEEREDGFKKLFNLPQEVIPLAYVVIGHPDQNLKIADRFKPERVHYERW